MRPRPVLTAWATHAWLITGSMPGIAASTRLTWALGAPPNAVALMPSATDLYRKELLDQIPAWIAMTTLFESDALVMDEVYPNPPGQSIPTNHVSTLATHLPGTTVAAFEAHDVGTSIRNAVKLYQGIPASPVGFHLSHVVFESNIDSRDASAIPLYAKIGDGIAAQGRDDAFAIVEQIRKDVAGAKAGGSGLGGSP